MAKFQVTFQQVSKSKEISVIVDAENDLEAIDKVDSMLISDKLPEAINEVFGVELEILSA